MVTVNILDASALITSGIPKNKNITVEEVYEEIKDRQSKLEMDLNSINVERVEQEYLKKINEVSELTGDVHKLSIADKKLLALALKHQESGEEVRVISDDYAIQNISVKLGFDYMGVRQKEIDEEIVWRKTCKGCHKEINRSDLDKCPRCGSDLKLIPKNKDELK